MSPNILQAQKDSPAQQNSGNFFSGNVWYKTLPVVNSSVANPLLIPLGDDNCHFLYHINVMLRSQMFIISPSSWFELGRSKED